MNQVQTSLPPSIVSHPLLTQWFGVEHLPRLTVYTGKVELGQGIQTALRQIAAQELGLDLQQIHWVAGNTAVAPNELYTAGSLSIENGGAALKSALGFARWIFLQAAAKNLGVAVSAIEIRQGIFSSSTSLSNRTVSYAELASQVNLNVPIQGSMEIDQSVQQVKMQVVGQDIARDDLIAKLSGAAFIHDMVLPEMRHARMIRSGHVLSTIETLDLAAMQALAGVEQVVRNGNFLALVGQNEALLVAAAAQAQELVTWKTPSYIGAQSDTESMLLSSPSGTEVVYEHGSAQPVTRTIQARYTRPFIAHASIGPACALAQIKDGQITVWSHTQGPHLLRDSIAKALRQEPHTVQVIHAHGAGCYGHNSADDVGFDAAFLAKETGFSIRVQWGREEELAASPFGAPSMSEIEAGIDEAGRIVRFATHIWSPTHIARPGSGGGLNLFGAYMIDPPHPVDVTKDNPLPQGGGLRNAISLYDFPQQILTHHMVPQVPLRTSALRSLGAYLNVFAMESFMDELALDLGQDPIALRLSYLKDPRSRNLLTEVAKMANWSSRDQLPEGTGLGVAFSRYKNAGAYCAVIAKIRVEEKIHVENFWCTTDVGKIINPDGLANQIEGGIIQSMSWTLKEMVTWDQQSVLSKTWDTYPILMFDEVPEVEVKLFDQVDQPSLGGGEASAGPTGAAIANALASALGIRARHLPFTAERLAQLIAS